MEAPPLKSLRLTYLPEEGMDFDLFGPSSGSPTARCTTKCAAKSTGSLDCR